jgi:hypothetical protein
MAPGESRSTTLLTLETGEAFMLQHFSFTIKTGVQQYGALYDPQPMTQLEGRGEINPDVFSIGETRFEQSAILAIHTKTGDMTVHARLFTLHHD